jgi:hypothetical protein
MQRHSITRDFELNLTGTFTAKFRTTPYDPGVTSGPPERCYPPEGGEVEDLTLTAESVNLFDEDGDPISVMFLKPETRKALLAAISTVLDEIETATGNVKNAIEEDVIEPDGPDPDELWDRARDDRLMGGRP